MFRHSFNLIHALREGERPSQPSALLGNQRQLEVSRERCPAAMPSSSAQREPTLEYLNCVEREEELGRLRNQAKIRKSLLVFGPEGVGKSRIPAVICESWLGFEIGR